MHGQFKSTVRCPEPDCNHVSVSFEPYSQISLPIPQLTLMSKVLTWVPYAVSEKSSMHLVTIKSHESIRNFRKYLTQDTLSKMGLSDRKNGFEIALVKDEHVHRVLSDGNEVSDIESVCDSFLFVYELPPVTQPSSQRHEMLQRISHNKLSAVCNISVIDYPRRERTLMFPRFLVVSLD